MQKMQNKKETRYTQKMQKMQLGDGEEWGDTDSAEM